MLGSWRWNQGLPQARQVLWPSQLSPDPGVMCESREKWLNQGCWREGLVESEGGQQGLEME